MTVTAEKAIITGLGKSMSMIGHEFVNHTVQVYFVDTDKYEGGDWKFSEIISVSVDPEPQENISMIPQMNNEYVEKTETIYPGEPNYDYDGELWGALEEAEQFLIQTY